MIRYVLTNVPTDFLRKAVMETVPNQLRKLTEKNVLFLYCGVLAFTSHNRETLVLLIYSGWKPILLKTEVSFELKSRLVFSSNLYKRTYKIYQQKK